MHVIDGAEWRKFLTSSSVHVVRMLVNPQTATAMLFQNRRNRSLRPSKVRGYAATMSAGRWNQDHPDTIAFTRNGDLINGQHRLRAICASNSTLLLNVAFGCEDESRLTVDGHTAKSLGDRMWIAGMGIGQTATGARKSAELALRMWHGPSAKKDQPAPHEIAAFIEVYHDAITFVMDIFGSKHRGRLTTAPVKSAVGHAFYHASADRLKRYVDVLLSGEASGSLDERNIILFRNWILEGRYARNSNAAGEVYRRAARSIEAFINLEPLKQLKDISYDPFPLPDRSATAPRLVSHRMAGGLGFEGAGGSTPDPMAETSSAIS